MSWSCSVSEISLSRTDSMQRHVMSKHRNVGLTPFQTVLFRQKCQRFRFQHPFTSMIAGMTGSDKTISSSSTRAETSIVSRFLKYERRKRFCNGE